MESVTFWRRAAILSVGILAAMAAYLFVWPVLMEGRMANRYISACIEAGICPDGTLLDQRLAEKRARPAAAKPPTAPESAPVDPAQGKKKP